MPAAPPKNQASSRAVAAKAEKATPEPKDAEANEAAAPATLRLKELVDRVAASTGGKKKGVKEIVEATLTQLGLALHAGEMLNLPEFGKVRVAKPQGAAPGSAMTLKLRPVDKGARKKTTEAALAEPADHS